MTPDQRSFAERLAAVERKAAGVRDGRDGRDGRDADPPIPGERGERGERGEPGAAGKDADHEALMAFARAEVLKAFEKLPPPKDGEPGRPPTEAEIELAVLRFLEIAPPPPGRDGERGERGLRGSKGERGQQGPRGEEGPSGPAPSHEWDGTKLRFEQPDGRWGEWVDLRGPRGPRGPGGVGGGSSNGEVPVVVATTNSYFPGGWG